MGWLSAPFLRAAASNGGGPGGVGLRGLSANRLPTKERELEGQRSLALPPKALAHYSESPATVHVKRGSSSLPMGARLDRAHRRGVTSLHDSDNVSGPVNR